MIIMVVKTMGEICCTTIITDTDFGTKIGVLLKQNPENMVIALVSGRWKGLEETVSGSP